MMDKMFRTLLQVKIENTLGQWLMFRDKVMMTEGKVLDVTVGETLTSCYASSFGGNYSIYNIYEGKS